MVFLGELSLYTKFEPLKINLVYEFPLKMILDCRHFSKSSQSTSIKNSWMNLDCIALSPSLLKMSCQKHPHHLNLFIYFEKIIQKKIQNMMKH